jgi:hypothetical protein
VRFAGDAGAHGWTAAHSRELWVDVSVVGPLCDSYLTAAAAKRGAAAADAAARKHTKYRYDIPGLAHFVPLAFESEGFVSPDVERLLSRLAKKKADRKSDLPEKEAKAPVKRAPVRRWRSPAAPAAGRPAAPRPRLTGRRTTRSCASSCFCHWTTSRAARRSVNTGVL